MSGQYLRGLMKATEITYVKGDATKPVQVNALIAHICNNNRQWGAGFVLALDKSHPHAKRDYAAMFRHSRPKLGAVSFAEREGYLPIANMVAQDNVTPDLKVRVQYEALRECLKRVAAYALLNECSVHMPRIGTGIGKGKWSIIQKIIESELCVLGIEVFVYNKTN
jgi:O-acetyl-ADP-ribose deacetylase (regulator of RNase III)